MNARSLPDEWEVAVGPRSDPRYFSVPDAGLQEFLRALTAQGEIEFQISSSGWVFRIEQLAAPPDACARGAGSGAPPHAPQ
jgi:hypothetical protein